VLKTGQSKQNTNYHNYEKATHNLPFNGNNNYHKRTRKKHITKTDNYGLFKIIQMEKEMENLKATTKMAS
jgi:hypothetical protein